MEEDRLKMDENQKMLKRELQKNKDNEQELNLKIDQKELEMNSIKCELKTYK